MNRHGTFFCFSSAMVLQTAVTVLFFLFLVTPSLAQVSAGYSGPAVSYEERAAQAAQQLRDIHRTTKQRAQASEMRTLAGASAEVGIRLNRDIKSISSIFFYDNMESGANGWTSVAYTGADLWHQTTLSASSATHSWWPGLEPQGTYNNGQQINCALLSPVISLAGAVAPVKLLFTESYATELGWDFCMVDVSTDAGVTWNHLRGGLGAAPSGDSEGWIITTLDLSAYAGMSITLRFSFNTIDEKFNDFPGWFVDDMVIFDQGGLVTGKKFFDVNNNQIKDPDERGIKDWLITAGGGPINLTTKTNYRGRYWLPLPLGSYTISEEFMSNWTQSYPLAGHWNVTLSTPDTLVDSIHFGNYTHASFVRGVVFDDVNQNGVKDTTDGIISEWKIVLADTSGNEIDFDRTDSLGTYELYIFQPGRYMIKEINKKGWVQTYPAGNVFMVDIPDLNTFIDNMNFGNYYSPVVNSITGMKFNDRNRNHALDTLEMGVPGATIKLLKKLNQAYRTTKTDSGGFYQFLSVPPDTYKVREEPLYGWWQSYPESLHIVVLDSLGHVDNVDFGNYGITTGSISGTKFNDLNGNGLRDTNEAGLSGWTLAISGTSVYNTQVSTSTETDQNGNYSIAGLWPGTYSVSEVFRPYWRQTYPANLQPHILTLGPEENRAGVNFGNISDSTFVLSFRSFLPESLALAVDAHKKHLPIKPTANKVLFCITFENHDVGNRKASELILKLGVPAIDSLAVSEPGTTQIFNDKKNRFEIVFPAPLDTGTVVTVCGIGKNSRPQKVTKWWWKFSDLSTGDVMTSANFTQNALGYPMPNAINLLQAGAGNGLKVGVGGPHTVLHATYKDVMRSLIERNDRMHSGDPRCLDKYTNQRSIKKQIKNLTPTKGQNKLFAEAIALQANIRGSDFGITPPGFANLIFDEGTGIDQAHPLNGKLIRRIADLVDQYMSSYADTGTIHQCTMPPELTGFPVDSLWAKIRMIDMSFSGVIDTISFFNKLVYKGVRQLTDVPYLRLDTSAAAMDFAKLQTPPTAVPDQFMLFQNYPNPFNPTTMIDFYLPMTSVVTLKIYNTLGQEVSTLIDRQETEAGSTEIELSSVTAKLASGVYYYRLIAEPVKDADEPQGETFTSVKKMILLK